jgi:hypothetical protein
MDGERGQAARETAAKTTRTVPLEFKEEGRPRCWT